MIARALAIASERLGNHRAGVLARLGGPLGHATRAVRDDGKTQRTQARAAACAPVPLGLRAVHASWIEAALAALPARARHALAGASDPVDVWLARWATSAIPPMSGYGELDALLALPVAELVARLVAIGGGGEQLAALQAAGRALTSHDPLARMALARRLPRPLGLVVERGPDACKTAKHADDDSKQSKTGNR